MEFYHRAVYLSDFIHDENRLDCHGLRRDEAIAAVDKFLDSKFLEGKNFVDIVHGYGNGILKQAIDEYLKTSPYVKNILTSPGSIVVELKERIE